MLKLYGAMVERERQNKFFKLSFFASYIVSLYKCLLVHVASSLYVDLFSVMMQPYLVGI